MPNLRTLAALALLAGCAEQRTTDGTARRPDFADPPAEEAYLDAEARTGVPAELLMAISQAETGLQMVVGEEEFPGKEPGNGVMGLRGADLELGAELAGVKPADAHTDRKANILAAAALLADWADEEGIDTGDLDAWAPVVARYSGIDDEEAASHYVWDEVYAALENGIEAEGLSVSPRAVAPNFPMPAMIRAGDGGAIWTPSPNYNSRSGASVELVVIHTCEGSYSSCWSWLANSASGVSAHYVVNDKGTEVRQLVDENNRAWHAAATYDCDNNYGQECGLDGKSSNTISVGIEHAGYASQSSWNAGLITTSAELTCGITKRHAIPRDKYHIVGHGQIQPYNRTDPGANWPWSDYIAQVQAECGDGGSSSSGSGSTSTSSGSTFVIDSNNAANDETRYYTAVGSGWTSSTNVSGYYNTGYWVAPTGSVSDATSFWFYASGSTCYTVEAWWPAASDRNPSATFIAYDASDSEVGRKAVDQRSNGGKWNKLGSWTFSGGWNRVALSRWAGSGYYVVADAVRLTPCS